MSYTKLPTVAPKYIALAEAHDADTLIDGGLMYKVAERQGFHDANSLNTMISNGYDRVCYCNEGEYAVYEQNWLLAHDEYKYMNLAPTLEESIAIAWLMAVPYEDSEIMECYTEIDAETIDSMRGIAAKIAKRINARYGDLVKTQYIEEDDERTIDELLAIINSEEFIAAGVVTEG
jgi:hypothetical protein